MIARTIQQWVPAKVAGSVAVELFSLMGGEFGSALRVAHASHPMFSLVSLFEAALSAVPIDADGYGTNVPVVMMPPAFLRLGLPLEFQGPEPWVIYRSRTGGTEITFIPDGDEVLVRIDFHEISSLFTGGVNNWRIDKILQALPGAEYVAPHMYLVR